MSDKHIIWTSDIGSLDDWKDFIEEDVMQKDDEYKSQRIINAQNAWAVRANRTTAP